MMTYRVGACATPSSGKAMAEYYLAGTLKTEPTRAAAYYTGAEAREERAAEFWRDAIRRATPPRAARSPSCGPTSRRPWRHASASPIPAGR